MGDGKGFVGELCMFMAVVVHVSVCQQLSELLCPYVNNMNMGLRIVVNDSDLILLFYSHSLFSYVILIILASLVIALVDSKSAELRMSLFYVLSCVRRGEVVVWLVLQGSTCSSFCSAAFCSRFHPNIFTIDCIV